MPKNKKTEEVIIGGENATPVKKDKPRIERPEPPKNTEEQDVLLRILDEMQNFGGQMEDIKQRVHDMETGGVDQFKREARPEDIEMAQETRSGVDPKIVTIVNEMLGEDFGVEMNGLGDRPGHRLTIIVPPRLSDTVAQRRPVYERDENGNLTNKYVKDEFGNTVYEDYQPEDRRSRIMSSSESYDSVRQHCERIRGYIVSHFQRNNKPLPEFKVK